MKYPKAKQLRVRKVKKAPKVRKPTRKTLIRKLDEIVSKIIRKRYKACVVCGSRENITAGHLFSRSHYSMRWSFENVFPQCLSCNLKHEHNPMPFYNWYMTLYGWEKMRETYARWNQISKYKDYELETLYEKLLLIYTNL